VVIIVGFCLIQVIEQSGVSGVIEAPGLRYRNIPAVVTTAVGQMVNALPIAYVVNISFCLLT
jgi:hypothetical protein